MEPLGWFTLGLGLVSIIGAWTNWLNYSGDREKDISPNDYIGGLLFHFVFFKNRKAYRIFLWILGIIFIIGTIYLSPALRTFFT